MSKRSRAKSKQAAQRQPAWLVPAIIAIVGVLFFALGNQLLRPPEPASGVRLVGTKQYAGPPPMTIDPARTYTATIRTAKGDIIVHLYADKAPIAVNSFVFLAQQGYFDGVTFHRVLPDFVAQAGDPTGTGAGGPGYQFDNETSDLTFDGEGVVAMANAGPNTNGSQFFITYRAAPELNGSYTIFGQVTSGMDVVRALTPRDPNNNPTTPGDMIETIFIAEQ